MRSFSRKNHTRRTRQDQNQHLFNRWCSVLFDKFDGICDAWTLDLFLKDQVPLKYRFSAPFLRKVKLRLNQSRLWLKCCPKVKCRTHSGSLISEIDRKLLEWEFHSSCGRHSCKTCLKPNGGAIENGRNLYEKTSCENPTESNCDHSHVRVRDRSCWIFAWS